MYDHKPNILLIITDYHALGMKKHEKIKCDSTVITFYSSHFHRDSRDCDLIKKYGAKYHPLYGSLLNH